MTTSPSHPPTNFLGPSPAPLSATQAQQAVDLLKEARRLVCDAARGDAQRSPGTYALVAGDIGEFLRSVGVDPD